MLFSVQQAQEPKEEKGHLQDAKEPGRAEKGQGTPSCWSVPKGSAGWQLSTGERSWAVRSILDSLICLSKNTSLFYVNITLIPHLKVIPIFSLISQPFPNPLFCFPHSPPVLAYYLINWRRPFKYNRGEREPNFDPCFPKPQPLFGLW